MGKRETSTGSRVIAFPLLLAGTAGLLASEVAGGPVRGMTPNCAPVNVLGLAAPFPVRDRR